MQRQHPLKKGTLMTCLMKLREDSMGHARAVKGFINESVKVGEVINWNENRYHDIAENLNHLIENYEYLIKEEYDELEG